MLGVLPLFHVFAMTSVLNDAIETGSEMVLLPRFELKQVLRTIERHPTTIFPAVPTIYGAINAAVRAQRRDLTSIKMCISGGAPLPAESASGSRRSPAAAGGGLRPDRGVSRSSPAIRRTGA